MESKEVRDLKQSPCVTICSFSVIRLALCPDRADNQVSQQINKSWTNFSGGRRQARTTGQTEPAQLC